MAAGCSPTPCGHPDFLVTRAADVDSAEVARVGDACPGIGVSAEVGDVIGAAAADAVYIATPPATHAALVVAALEAGQAVFCEKPLAVSDVDAEAMLAAARAPAVNFSLSDRRTTRN